jgi:hypothetical protein
MECLYKSCVPSLRGLARSKPASLLLGLRQKPVMAGLTRHLPKICAYCQEIAGLRFASPAMTQHVWKITNK